MSWLLRGTRRLVRWWSKMATPFPVLISSTGEFEEERTRLRDALNRLSFVRPLVFEHEAVVGEAPADVSEALVESCACVVLLVGRQAGTPAPERDGRTYTQVEAEHALELGKPLLMYVVRQQEAGGSLSAHQLPAWFQPLSKQTTFSFFEDEADLLQRVTADIASRAFDRSVSLRTTTFAAAMALVLAFACLGMVLAGLQLRAELRAVHTELQAIDATIAQTGARVDALGQRLGRLGRRSVATIERVEHVDEGLQSANDRLADLDRLFVILNQCQNEYVAARSARRAYLDELVGELGVLEGETCRHEPLDTSWAEEVERWCGGDGSGRGQLETCPGVALSYDSLCRPDEPLVLSLPDLADRGLFHPCSAQPQEESWAALDLALASALGAAPAIQGIRVDGYTDETQVDPALERCGGVEDVNGDGKVDNTDLSIMRARVVADRLGALVGEGVALSAVGRGEDRSRSCTSLEGEERRSCLQAKRRIELTLSGRGALYGVDCD